MPLHHDRTPLALVPHDFSIAGQPSSGMKRSWLATAGFTSCRNFRGAALFDRLADAAKTAGLEHVAAFAHADHRRPRNLPTDPLATV
jgi:hypothetical protein